VARARVLLKCRRAHALLSRRCDAPLAWRERVALHLHLRACAACRRVAQHWALLARALRSLEHGAAGERRPSP